MFFLLHHSVFPYLQYWFHNIYNLVETYHEQQKEHMRLYRSVIACVIKSSNLLPCNLEQMFLLYHGPLFNQSRWLLLVFISYSISWLELIIHDIPTWCNISFNKNLVTISSYTQVKLVSEFKPVSLLQWIHFIDTVSKYSYL